jgi:hypothetical protein
MTTTAVKLADGTDSGRDRDRIISERGPAGYDSRTNGSALRQSRSMRMRLHRSFYYCFFQFLRPCCRAQSSAFQFSHGQRSLLGQK